MNNKQRVLLMIAAGLIFSGVFNLTMAANDNKPFSHLPGRWLIKAEDKGQAYYVSPTDQLAYSLGNLSQVQCLIKAVALGISETDYNRFNAATAPSRLAGRIIFRAHSKGQVYYVGLLTHKLYPINSPAEISYLLRLAGLGISNSNLNKIVANNKLSQQINNCQQSKNDNHQNQSESSIDSYLCFGSRVYINPLTAAACSKLNCYGLLKEDLKSRCSKGICGAECSDNETRACTINGQVGKQGCNPSYCQFFTTCGLPISSSQSTKGLCHGPKLEPAITISDNRPATLKPNFCSGEEVIFSATASNCQQPHYQWFINNLSQPGANQASYSTIVDNNDAIKVVLDCSDKCLVVNTASSSLSIGNAWDGTVTNLQLETAGDDSVNLSWDSSDCADSYEVWRGSEESTSTMSLIATTSNTFFSDQELYMARDYYYAIKLLHNNQPATDNFSDIVAYHRCQVPGELCLIQKYQQDFDDMGINLTLPNEWTAATTSLVRTINNYASSTGAVNYLGGNHYEGFETAAQGIYNFGAGDKDSATDRAIGGISSNSGSKSVNIYYAFTNTTTERISRLNVSYNAEKYRNGSSTAAFAINAYYSINGVYWIPVPDLTARFNGPDADNNGFTEAPGETRELSSNIDLIQELNVGDTMYLAWNYSVTSGTVTSNARALGIDDIVVKSYGEIGQTPGYRQNFDGIGTSATAVLPNNWLTARDTSTVRVINTSGSLDNKTSQVGGNNLTSGAANGTYNFGAGTSTTATDRSVGGLSSGSNSKSINFYYTFTNNTTVPIDNFDIDYDIEKYRNGSNPEGFSIALFYSYNFTDWADAYLGASIPADSDNNGFVQAPGSTVNISGNLMLPTPLSSGQQLNFAWNYSVTASSTTSNSQGLGIDNVDLKWQQ